MRLFRLGLFLCLPLFARIDPADWSGAPQSVEESLFLRRIADFWQEGEYGIAKSQMEEFLVSFPESSYADPIRACLGDLLLREKNYAGALKSYSTVSSPEFTAKVLLNRMQCLYHLEWYSTLADECETYLVNPTNVDTQLNTTYFLAIALYHQCLNASKEPETLMKLARRAEPYFETLFQSELSWEVSQAFAHLCCILKDYPKAAKIYLSLAEKDPLAAEEMNLQAALIQAEYDKEGALQSFESISQGKGKKAEEAAYNRLVLLFDLGRYEQIVSGKEALLSAVSEDRKGMAHFFVWRSLLALKNFSEAIADLQAYLVLYPDSEPALSCLMEAAYQSDDLKIFDSALAKLSENPQAGSQITSGRLSRVFLLKKSGNLAEALKELETILATSPDSPERTRAVFERIDLEYRAGSWESCREKASAFLAEHPAHELAPFAWRCLVSSSGRLAGEKPGDPSLTERFANDLFALLQHKELFPSPEQSDWQFFLAKALHDLGRLEDAAHVLRLLLTDGSPFPQEANSYLLLALCYRDLGGDMAAFCLNAEKAIEKAADLLELKSLYISLFNAYLDLSKKAPELMEKAAEYLFRAFEQQVANSAGGVGPRPDCQLSEQGSEIAKENILWLGEWYLSQFEQTPTPLFAKRAELVFSSLSEESAIYKLGKIYALTGRFEMQIALMEKLTAMYAADPKGSWTWKNEAQLLLAEGYAVIGKTEGAIALLDQMIDDRSTLPSETIAKAKLKRACLKAKRLQKGAQDEPERIQIASQLKDLILQRRLANEPLHLEAALEYVDLQSSEEKKRLALLEKIKADFESSEDLLAQDYQQARSKLQEKNLLYEGYMQLICAEIFLAKSHLATDLSEQKELQAKAKDLLLQIKREKAHPLLLNRALSVDVPSSE